MNGLARRVTFFTIKEPSVFSKIKPKPVVFYAASLYLFAFIPSNNL
jgi:hypothetical protein